MSYEPYRVVGPMTWKIEGGRVVPDREFHHKLSRNLEIKAIRAKFADLKRRVRGGK